jgi:hypothetical protein
VLFDDLAPLGSVFNAVRSLKNMNDLEAAGTIIERKIPFLVAKGALGQRIQKPELLLALIKSMSPTELVTNTNHLMKLGVNIHPSTRAAFLEATKASLGTRSFKAGRAAEFIHDEVMKRKMHDLQEKQLNIMQSAGNVDGNWLVLGDKSGSMQESIEVAKLIAATLAKMVKGNVHLVFFDTDPRYIDATGISYEDILLKTRSIVAQGGTSIGVGLDYLAKKNLVVDGIAIVSDGGENTAPSFAPTYNEVVNIWGKKPPIYFYKVRGEPDALTYNLNHLGIDYQTFDFTDGMIDFYSLPNLVLTMRSNRYSLIEEIFETPLKELDEVFTRRKELVKV